MEAAASQPNRSLVTLPVRGRCPLCAMLFICLPIVLPSMEVQAASSSHLKGVIGLESEVNSPPSTLVLVGVRDRMSLASGVKSLCKVQILLKLTFTVNLAYTCSLTTDYAYLNTESKRQKGKR